MTRDSVGYRLGSSGIGPGVPEMMALRAHHRGGPETLVYEPAPRPQLLPNEVLISVHAAGITFAELTWEETSTRECRSRNGGGGPLAALTAWQALVDHAYVTRGERILIHGGAGGVGVFAIQIARSLGLEISTTARLKDEEFLLTLGANRVIDYARERFDDRRGFYDVVLDGIGGEVTIRSLRALKPGGRIVTLNGPAPEKLAHQLHVFATFFIVRGTRTGLDRITALIDGGLLRVVVSATYPVSQGRDAFESATFPNRLPGKTVLIVKNDDSRV